MSARSTPFSLFVAPDSNSDSVRMTWQLTRFMDLFSLVVVMIAEVRLAPRRVGFSKSGTLNAEYHHDAIPAVP